MTRHRLVPILFFLLVMMIFFRQFFLFGKLPIPADTIVGLYHPFRDYLVKEHPRGVPYKNFLITDPVRQQYPFRSLTIDSMKNLGFPKWNPYVLAGSPLSANVQSAAFYPLNVLFFIMPFWLGWSLLVFLQPVLAATFLYLYLRNLKLEVAPATFGSIVFALSGFSIAWLEWNTIGHVALWLPMLLLATDKIFANKDLRWTNKKPLCWMTVFLAGLISSVFAGHLQTFFYSLMFLMLYIIVRWYQHGRRFRVLSLFLLLFLISSFVTAVQWVPAIELILQSARGIDQADWMREGWFIPWQHLVQFLVPDFFGNPSTLNYWGTWNYGELVGYVGLLPLLIAFVALFYRHDKKTLFFGILFFSSLAMSLPTLIAEIPFRLQFPFLASAQPTRLLFIADFSLAVLAALGFDHYLKTKKGVAPVLLFFGILFSLTWLFVLFGRQAFSIDTENITVATRNLLYSSALFIVSGGVLVAGKFLQKKYTLVLVVLVLGVAVFDLLRFAEKFTPFTERNYLYPTTRTIAFLQKNTGFYRIMSTDDRILPPNFSIQYRLQTVGGYDPLYLKKYSELIAASERGEPNISGPLGFNRIITPHRHDSQIMDLLGVKYVLSIQDLESEDLEKVFQEGETRVYENKKVIPRAFFVKRIIIVGHDQEAIDTMFTVDLASTAVVSGQVDTEIKILQDVDGGDAEITEYSNNKVIIRTRNAEEGFLVLTDNFYPGWKAKIIEQSTGDEKSVPLYRVDYSLRGVSVPAGDHRIEFSI